jgi:hypothetical protein
MASRYELSEALWERIRNTLPGRIRAPPAILYQLRSDKLEARNVIEEVCDPEIPSGYWAMSRRQRSTWKRNGS